VGRLVDGYEVMGYGGVMRKATAILGSSLFFVIAPFLAAAVIPWWITRWEFQPAFIGIGLTRAIGVLFILCGVPGLVDSFARFALEGLGTPAPVAPPKHLVVTGLYRHVRNPMYVSALAVIFGQAFLFADWRLAVYGAVFWLACHIFVLVYEEPTLLRTFGTQYEAFCANVPRWIPRLAAWRG
jgi:protein-S-isoprenylcysteine O-methyltransferase Ste14